MKRTPNSVIDTILVFTEVQKTVLILVTFVTLKIVYSNLLFSAIYYPT